MAVKIIPFNNSVSASSKKRIIKEIQLLQKLEHPNIVSYLGNIFVYYS
jgi:hypothetical protein